MLQNFKVVFLHRRKFLPELIEGNLSLGNQRIGLSKLEKFRLYKPKPAIRSSKGLYTVQHVLHVKSVLTQVTREFASVHEFAHWHWALSSPCHVIACITYATMNYH